MDTLLDNIVAEERRLAMRRDKPILLELSPTHFHNCYYIQQAAIVNKDGQAYRVTVFSQMERLIDRESLIFLDDAKELQLLYDIVSRVYGFRLNRKTYQWHLQLHGVFILVDSTNDSNPQTARCLAFCSFAEILNDKEVILDKLHSCWKLPTEHCFEDLFLPPGDTA